ncbi:MAG: LamG-like jellyroll fold domain-containing protein [Aureliella sp.]
MDSSKVQQLIYQLIDGTISEDDFARLQDALDSDADVRQGYLRAIGLTSHLERAAAASGGVDITPRSLRNRMVAEHRSGGTHFSYGVLAAAAAMMLLVGAAAFWLGNQFSAPEIAGGTKGSPAVEPLNQSSVTNDASETRIAGHATLRRIVDLKWSAGANQFREGDVLPNGSFQFDEGVAEVDFFCGATLILEGPAELEIESDWSARLAAGRLRASVPLAARGFVVYAKDSEIIDLGTEFAVSVGEDSARVEVIDGEVELRGGEHDGKHLLTGERATLEGPELQTAVAQGLSTVADLQQRRQAAEKQRHGDWKTQVQKLSEDSRLIAYYPIAFFDESGEGAFNAGAGRRARSWNERRVPNQSMHGDSRSGFLVGPVLRTAGRFGASTEGLDFKRAGARVRTRIEGEFDAFTFACWARIDRLEHRYNALFMADGYETGEPHWQIRDDGRMMFSVMVDDTQDVRFYNKREQRTVRDAGLHRVYYTEPFFDDSDRGKWFHLAAVYDPVGKRVKQFVNGVEIASEAIEARYQISALKIGAAEIGNWGQPFRDSPWFAVRNLNGTIDELVIWNAALGAAEIENLYQYGKPLGY